LRRLELVLNGYDRCRVSARKIAHGVDRIAYNASESGWT
jgi:hypothetical protein